MIFTSSTVVRPPRPWAPIPSWLTFSNSSRRISSIRLEGPRFFSSWMSMDSINTSLAMTAAFSAVPPMPMPSMPGGHQPAPMVGRVEHGHFRLVLGTTALGGHIHFHGITRDDGVVDHRRGVVLGVFTRARWIGEDRSTQDVFRQVVGATHAFVDHVVQAHGGAVPTHVHAYAHEHSDDTGVLADRAVAGGAHARVDQDLGDGVTGCWRFFAQVGFVHCLDEVNGMVVGNELQGVGNALNQVVLLDHGHESRSSNKGTFNKGGFSGVYRSAETTFPRHAE